MKLGILGAGQLGQMLALAAIPLGVQCRFYDTASETCADVAGPVTRGRWDDEGALLAWADGLDAITYEFENVPVDAAHLLSGRVPLYPPPAALQASQDRVSEKELFARLGIPTAPWSSVSSLRELETAAQRLGLPAVLKTRRLGYDGKGQITLRRPDECASAWERLGDTVPGLILEKRIAFEREVSLLAVRGRGGATAFYPLVENEHREGILHTSVAPAGGPAGLPELEREAQGYATRLLDELRYVGVLAIEFFVERGRLLANEMAPRVHNSGHWTLEGAATSQFENHVRAVLGWPLGSTVPVGCSGMLNLVGTLPPLPEVLALPGAHLHLYGKSPRPGRKLGHVTIVADQLDDVRARLETLTRGARA